MIEDIQEFRIARLIEASKKAGGDTALERLLGYSNGAYIGQLKNKWRPIKEDFIQKLEALPGYAVWFASPKELDLEKIRTSRQFDGCISNFLRAQPGLASTTGGTWARRSHSLNLGTNEKACPPANHLPRRSATEVWSQAYLMETRWWSTLREPNPKMAVCSL